MKTSSVNIIARMLSIFYILAVCLLCFAKIDGAVTVTPVIFGLPSDKLAHFIMFFPFPMLAFLSFDKKNRKPLHSLLFVLAVLIVGCCFAAGTELVQGWLGYRSSDRADFIADCISIAISGLIVLIIDINIPCSKKS